MREPHHFENIAASCAEKGNLKLALDFYRKAFAACRARYAESPSIEDLKGIVSALRGVASILESLSRWDQALVFRQKIVQLGESLDKHDPSFEGRRERVYDLWWLIDLQTERGEFEQSGMACRRAVELARQLIIDPVNAEARLLLSGSYQRAVDLFMAQNHIEQAEETCNAALQAQQSTPGETPSIEHFHQVALLKGRMGDILNKQDRIEEAIVFLRNAAALCTEIEKLDPQPAIVRNGAVFFGRLASAYKQKGALDEAANFCLESIRRREFLSSFFSDPLTRQDLALGYRHMGDIVMQQGNPGMAEKYFRKALGISALLTKEHPRIMHLQVLYSIRMLIGDSLFEQDRFPQALKYYSQALKQAAFNAEQVSTPINRFAVTRALAEIARVQARRNRMDSALLHLVKAMKMLEDLLAEFPCGNYQRWYCLLLERAGVIVSFHIDLKAGQAFRDNAVAFFQDGFPRQGVVASPNAEDLKRLLEERRRAQSAEALRIRNEDASLAEINEASFIFAAFCEAYALSRDTAWVQSLNCAPDPCSG